MSHLNNLQRDQLHVKKEVLAYTPVPTSAGIGLGQIPINASPEVEPSTGVVQMIALAPTHANGNWAGAGVYLDPPASDDTPYRVKGRIRCSNAAAYEVFVVVGYAPATITGSGDTVTVAISVPVNGEFDEVVLMPKLNSGDANFERPLAFVMAVGQASGTEKFDGYMSVQKLSTASPQYASSVS